jgi:hypothetical protein
MIIPEGQEAVADSTPLTISAQKRTAMVAKAKELLTEPMEVKGLMNALEQYYVADNNEHYTSAQLLDIAKQVQEDLAPEVAEEE